MRPLRFPLAPSTLVLAALVAVSACHPASTGGGGFAVEAPGRLRQGLSDALCQRLNAKLIFKRSEGFGPAAVDQALIRDNASPCRWVLGEKAYVVGGTYDLTVRFELAETPAECSKPVLVGMYYLTGVKVPYVEGQKVKPTDTDFFSTVADAERLKAMKVEETFNEDGDARDNLAELVDGTRPCHAETIPKPTVAGLPGNATEGVPFSFTFGSTDADGEAHRVVLSLSHSNAPEPKVLTVSARTDSGAPVPSPALAERTWKEEWDVQVGGDTEAGEGSGRWSVTFTPQEPFVGTLVVRAKALDGTGQTLAESEPYEVVVAEDPALDPPLLSLDRTRPPATTLEFPEQPTPSATVKVWVVDRNLESPSSNWSVEIDPAAWPEGLSIAKSGDGWDLSFAATNTLALASPLPLKLLLFDSLHASMGQIATTITVTPLLNDAPVIVPPSSQYLALSPPAIFTEPHLVVFHILDIDRVDSPPTCTATVTPVSPTTCTNAFSKVECGSRKPRDGDDWEFAVGLTPSATYASCGASPAFDVQVKVDDVAPAGSRNASLSDTKTFKVMTAESMVVHRFTNGPAGATAAFVDGSMAPAGGVGGRALVMGSSSFAVMDLSPDGAQLVQAFTATDLCSIGGVVGQPYTVGEVDLVNHRVVLSGQVLPGSGSCADGLAAVDLKTPAVTRWTLSTVCGSGMSNPYISNPVIDPRNGNAYVVCSASSTTRIVKLDAAGTLTRTDVTGSAIYGNQYQVALAEGANGHAWLAYYSTPSSQKGFMVVDVDSLSGPVSKVHLPAAYAESYDMRLVDTERQSILYVWESSGKGYVGRIKLGGATPALEATPLDLGTTKYSAGHLIARRRPYRAGKTPSPHLLATMGSDSGTTMYGAGWIDLDTWTIARSGSMGDFDQHGMTEGFFESPDRRNFLQVIDQYSPTGWATYRWEGGAPTVTADSTLYSKHLDTWVTSWEGNCALAFTGDAAFYMLAFPSAALGLDE